MFNTGTFVRLADLRRCFIVMPMSTKPEDKHSLEDVVKLLCEYVGQMSEEEKAQLRYELLNGAEAPPHMRWEN